MKKYSVARYLLKSFTSLFEISKTEDVWIHTYIGDEIVTEENNPYTEIEGEITGMPIIVVDDFKML